MPSRVWQHPRDARYGVRIERHQYVSTRPGEPTIDFSNFVIGWGDTVWSWSWSNSAKWPDPFKLEYSVARNLSYPFLWMWDVHLWRLSHNIRRCRPGYLKAKEERA